MPETPDDMFSDDHPSYTMGSAADLLGTSQDFLRRLGELNLITPHRTAGGHRHYSRRQLRLAARARKLVDEGMSLEAACRIIGLEDELEQARNTNNPQAAGPAT